VALDESEPAPKYVESLVPAEPAFLRLSTAMLPIALLPFPYVSEIPPEPLVISDDLRHNGGTSESRTPLPSCCAFIAKINYDWLIFVAPDVVLMEI
jgi:hypothetical protein